MKKQMNWKGAVSSIQFKGINVHVHGSIIVSVRAAALLAGPGPFVSGETCFFKGEM